MFERFTKPSALESAQKAATSLMSERGEANARGVAGKLVNQFKLLDKAEQLKFFEFLAKQFSPDPGAVLDAAQRYSETADYQEWLTLWKGYQVFYKANIPEATTATTWSRFQDPSEPMHCAVAEVEGRRALHPASQLLDHRRLRLLAGLVC